jgi:YD repeat-containing protein
VEDLVRLYAQSGGNVIAESFYGGDATAAGHTDAPGDLCNSAGTQYKLLNTWSNGQLATSKSNGMSFFGSDQTIDANTGLASSARDATGLATSFTYDALGRITAATPEEGARSSYTYHDASGSTLPSVDLATYPHDPQSTSALTQSKYLFDGLGRLTTEKQLLPGGVWNRRVTAYDASGRRSKVYEVEADGSGTPAHFTEFTYDSLGRVITVTPPDQAAALAAGTSHLVTTSYVGARQTTSTSMVAASRNAAGNVIETAFSRINSFDAQGRLIGVTEPSGTDNANTATSYTYDTAGRLTQVNLAGQMRTFTYDHRGLHPLHVRPLRQHDPQVDPHPQHRPHRLEHRRLHRRLPHAGRPRHQQADNASHHDSAGRMTTMNGATYTWDAASMMVTLSDDHRDLTYLYTADDERIGIISRLAPATNTAWSVRGFGNQLLRLYVNDPTSGWSWKEDEIFRGIPLLASEAPGVTLHYAVDHLGSPEAISDTSGTLLATPTYAAFGEGGTVGGGRLQYTGHERDTVMRWVNQQIPWITCMPGTTVPLTQGS